MRINNLVKWAAVQVPRGSGVHRRGGREGRGKAPAVYHGGRGLENRSAYCIWRLLEEGTTRRSLARKVTTSGIWRL